MERKNQVDNASREPKRPEPRLTKSQAIAIWQAAHYRRNLSEKLRKSFLENESLIRILKYPRVNVENALRQEKKLDRALEHLQKTFTDRPVSTEEKSSSAKRRLAEPTSCELKLWERLQNRQLDGYLFEREIEIRGWYADFYCAEHRLVIEVDGSSHSLRRPKDRQRDEVLRAEKYKVLRVTNFEVMNEIEDVLSVIRGLLPEAPSKKARRKSKTAQTTPRPIRKSAPKRPSKDLFGEQLSMQVSSHKQSSNKDSAVSESIVKGPVHCAGCENDFIGTYSMTTGLKNCRSCGNRPIALCRECRAQCFGDEGQFRCKACDPSVRAIAREAAGRGARHPTNNLKGSRRGKRIA